MTFSLSHGKPMEVGMIGLDATALPPFDSQGRTSRIDPREWFAPDRRKLPLELEIGSGKGTFLVQQAALVPGVNFLGVEWARAFWTYAADRCRRHGFPNVRLLNTDAAALVRHHMPDAVFQQVHIYFPDPWPKTRHHKRRLIQAPFLRELHRTLAPASRVRIATDHDDYFTWMLAETAQVTDLFEKLDFQSPESAGEGELVGTNFERKYRREGRPFHSMILLKK